MEANDKKRAVISPAAKAFILQQLRFFSSHPFFARKKAGFFFRFPIFFSFIAMCWVIWKGVNLDLFQIVSAFQGRSWLVGLILCVGVFGLSLAAAYLMSIRASISSGLMHTNKGGYQSSFSAITILLLGAISAGGFLFLVPRLIPAGLLDPSAAKKYAFVAAFLPYVLTLALFDFFSPNQVKKSKVIAVVFFGF